MGNQPFLPLPELEILPNNNESATVAYQLANSVAGSTYPFSATDNSSDGALPPLTSPADVVDVDDCDALGTDNDSGGDTSMSADSSANEINDGDD